MMKKFITMTVAFLLTFTIQIWTGSNVVHANDGVGEISKRSISVSGISSVKVAPDIAYIDIAVNTFDKDVKRAQETNTKNMNKVMQQLKSLGIQDKDIRTIDYRVQPRYEWKNVETKSNQGGIESKNVQILLGYDINNTVKVTVTEFQKIGSIIDITVKEGANQLNNIAFGLSEAKKTEKYLEALKGAVENGRSKAEFIASTYGIKLSIPAVINESGSYIPSPISYNGPELSKAAGSYDSVASTPISGGEMEISANVNIVYQY
ncbi:SIMPL domain-containing protein [Schinkia sp. CFF1]